MDISDYANLPAGAPPPGVMPNFDHPATRAIEAHIGMGICIGVTLVFVVLRLYVKLAITHMWGWDDCESFESFHRLFAENANGDRCLYIGIRKVFAHLVIAVTLTVLIKGTDRGTRSRSLYP